MKTLSDGDYKMDADGSIWIDVRGFTVHIMTTDEGIVTDIFASTDLVENVFSSPIASAYAFDHELNEA